MSAPIYPYSEWRHWPEEDSREWASEIAAAFSLAKYQASALVGELLRRAGHWRAPPEPADFPKRMTEETEASYAAAFFEWHATRTDGDDSRNSVALEIFEQNKRLNKPQETREPTLTA